MTDTIHSSSNQFFFTELAKIMNNAKVPPPSPSIQSDSSHKNIIISSGDNHDHDDHDDHDDDNICLISKDKLHPNHITLSCKHKFNYIPIYKEISYQKNKNNTSFEITKLLNNEIKCPYCRQITNKLLPYIPYPSVKQIKYVNSPQDMCMSAMKCQHVFRPTHEGDGGNDTKCDKYALYYEAENVLFCAQHFRQYEKRMKTIEDKKAKEHAKTQEKLAKQSSVPRCKAILRGGKNIGKPCDRIISVEGATVCKIHSS
jgi:hypothetical protein